MEKAKAVDFDKIEVVSHRVNKDKIYVLPKNLDNYARKVAKRNNMKNFERINTYYQVLYMPTYGKHGKHASNQEVELNVEFINDGLFIEKGHNYHADLDVKFEEKSIYEEIEM
jgi:hypothetical protein